jgi:pyruvate ferredoxin oxidoreductase alpha subunit
LFAETVQEAADLHVQAFRLAEELSVPVMVCMDGFILTHATERVDLPGPKAVDAFLPPYEPRQVLDPDKPYSIGAMVGPEAFEEVRYLAHAQQLTAIARISELAEQFAEAFGRDSGGLVHPYRTADADVVVVAMGSVLGTVKDVVDVLREEGVRIGALGLTSFRPFPTDAIRNALAGATGVVVLEKAFSVGFGGVLATDVAMALSGLPVPVRTVVAGLGGRPITKASLRAIFEAALAGTAPRLTFLDLDEGLVERELERMAATRRSGPTAENMLRDLGVVGSRIG